MDTPSKAIMPEITCEVHGIMPSPKGSCPQCESDFHELCARNLARMIRRGVWLIRREDGDRGSKVWAGKAYQLLFKYGLQGNPLRDDEPPQPECLQ